MSETQKITAHVPIEVLRRAQADPAGAEGGEGNEHKVIERGSLVLDPNRHACTWVGKPVRLTVTEFLILQSLAQRPGYVKSRDQLMDAAYDDQIYVDDRTVDVHIGRLRKSINIGKMRDPIRTVRGAGYSLETI